MLGQVCDVLAPALTAPDAVLVDATLGLGGHSATLLEAHPNVRLIGIDRDADALAKARIRLAGMADRVTLVQAVHDQLGAVLDAEGIAQVDAILFDLGVSSLQLDTVSRGFAYSVDAPLDMRMDARGGQTAADIVNTASVTELTRILADYGEERFARRIATRIVARRGVQPFTTSADLVDLVREAIPAATRRTGGNPAKRTFQALRIEVNGELDALATALPVAIDRLRIGGRLAVITFHSLEDRIVKRAFAARSGDRTPEGLPVRLPGHGPTLRLLERGTGANDVELATNPRAASARLRAVERVAA